MVEWTLALHIFLSSALDGSGLLVSCPSYFTSSEGGVHSALVREELLERKVAAPV
jgi:hypothetical protein